MKDKKKQSGGVEKDVNLKENVQLSVIPQVVNTKTAINSPFKQEKGKILQESKSIYNPSTQKPTLKLELYTPEKEEEIPQGMYNPYMPQVELPGFSKKFSPAAFGNLYAPTGAVSYIPNTQMPIQQVYNINLPGPTGGHVRMNKIYENILPGKDFKFTSTTLGERLQLYHYIRQILIKIDDGEDISIDSDGQNSLLSYIKFMELNPTYYSLINSNPYSGLPFGLLVYRSCFPITLDQTSQSIICGKNSIGLNIRLYALNYAEFYSYKFRQPIYKNYNVWRELAFYEYIKENILKKKQSPNFPILYAFFMCPNKKIDFFSLKKNCLTEKEITKEYLDFFDDKKIIRPITMNPKPNLLPDELDISLKIYSGTTLIIITEAPNQNIYQWASRLYKPNGIVQKMTATGYHSENVWLNIFFQITSALYVLQIHNIYIRDMTMRDNIYIKDLQNNGNAMGYWKYIIDGISYYIPNFGYIVFIDTNYKDLPKKEDCEREYKIYIPTIENKEKTIKEKIYENYHRIINTNSFTKEYTENNVNKPNEKVMNLLGKMMENSEIDIGQNISTYFRNFMNNRIGTYLRKETELPNIREISEPFIKGQMAIEVIDSNLYKWCLVFKINNNQTLDIITKQKPDDVDLINKTVRIETLKQYSSSEKIEQNSTNEINLSEDKLLETYLIN